MRILSLQLICFLAISLPELSAPSLLAASPFRSCIKSLVLSSTKILANKKSRKKIILGTTAAVVVLGLATASQFPIPSVMYQPYQANLTGYEWIRHLNVRSHFQEIDSLLSPESNYLIEIKFANDSKIQTAAVKSDTEKTFFQAVKFKWSPGGYIEQEFTETLSRKDYVRYLSRFVENTYDFTRAFQKRIQDPEIRKEFYSSPELDRLEIVVKYPPNFKNREFLFQYAGLNGRLPAPIPTELVQASGGLAKQSGFDPITTALQRIQSGSAKPGTADYEKRGLLYEPALGLPIQSLSPLFDSKDRALFKNSTIRISSDFPILLLWTKEVLGQSDWAENAKRLYDRPAYRERMEFMARLDPERGKLYLPLSATTRP